VLCASPLLQGSLLQSEVPQGEMLQSEVLQAQVLQADLLRSAEVLRSGPHLLRSAEVRTDLRRPGPGLLRSPQVLRTLLQDEVLQDEVPQGEVLQSEVPEGEVLQSEVLQAGLLRSELLLTSRAIHRPLTVGFAAAYATADAPSPDQIKNPLSTDGGFFYAPTERRRVQKGGGTAFVATDEMRRMKSPTAGGGRQPTEGLRSSH
jgi:hypothetical protein